MKDKKNIKYSIISAAGILLSALGLYLAVSIESALSFWLALPYVCLGAGCGIMGYGISTLITSKMLARNPDMQKQMEIDKKDERNILIINRAKAKAYDLMSFLSAVLTLLFALMGMDVLPILLFVSACLSVRVYALYCQYRYNREM